MRVMRRQSQLQRKDGGGEGDQTRKEGRMQQEAMSGSRGR